MRLEQIAPQTEDGKLFHVVIETSRGSRNKFSYDTETSLFRLKKTLPEGHVFPFDFGFVPRTKGADGDPLDVLVLMDAPAFPGCVVASRLIGCLQAKQTKEGKLLRNDRFLAVAETSVRFERVRDLRDLGATLRAQIEHFFVSYNEMAGNEFRVLKWQHAKAARRALERALLVSDDL